MREIIFRAKRVDNGEWIYGGIIPLDENCICIVPSYHSASTLSVRKLVAGLCEKVMPKTVGQFTGLVDAGGDKIFEGDILENAFGVNDTDNPKIKGMVVFHEGAFRLVDLKTINYVDFGTQSFEPYFPEFLEVVGNRFDNPELLEVNK